MRILALSMLLALCGCAHPYGPAHDPSVPVDTVVVISPEPERLPFDPRGARLRAALAELTGLLGHPVTFAIDGSLAEATRSGFEAQLIAGVESLARAVAAVREREPEAFAYGAALLHRVSCNYDATTGAAQVSLEPSDRTLRVVTAGRDGSLVPQRTAAGALLQAYDRYADERYGAVSPEQVPAEERAAYFRYLASARSMNADAVERGISERRGERFLRMFALEQAVASSEPKLASEVQQWLWAHRGYWVDAYNHHHDAASRAPAHSAFRRSEAVFVQWLNRRLPAMSDDDKRLWAENLFARRPAGHGYVRSSFPGFDKLGFALTIVDAWIRAGHPTQADGRRRNLLHEFIVCPHPRDPETGERTLGPRCGHDLYRYALENEQDTARLVDEVVRRGDPLLSETLFVAVRYAAEGGSAQPELLRLWRRAEPHEALWKLGARVIAEHLAEVSDRASLTDEARRLWRLHPSRRGELLYVVAHADPYGHGEVAWKDFHADYGSLASAADVASFLDQGPRSLERLPAAWPALGPGWSRTAVLVPRLERLLSSGRRQRETRAALHKLIGLLCADGASADVAQLRAWLQSRVHAHPGESLGQLLDATAPDACKPGEPSRAAGGRR